MHLVTALLYSGKWIGFIPGCLLHILDAVMKYWYINTCNTLCLTIKQQEIMLSYKTFKCSCIHIIVSNFITTNWFCEAMLIRLKKY